MQALWKDTALLLGIVLVICPVLLALGIRLLIVGKAGRLVSTRPCCTKCRFDLSGLMEVPALNATGTPAPAADEPAPPKRAAGRITLGPDLHTLFPSRCPECGADLTRPGNILPGEVRRRRGVQLIGLIITVLGAAPIALSGVGSIRQVNWNRYRSVESLQKLISTGDRMAGDELRQRATSGELSAVNVEALVAQFVIECDASRSNGPSPLVGAVQLLEMPLLQLHSAGMLSKEQLRRVLAAGYPLENWALAPVTTHRQVPSFQPTLTGAIARPKLATTLMSDFRGTVRLKSALAVDAKGKEIELVSMGSPTGYIHGAGGLPSIFVNLRQRLKSGKYTLRLQLDRSIAAGNTPVVDDVVTVQGPLRVLDDDDIKVTVQKDRQIGHQIIDRLKIHEIGLVKTYNNETVLRVWMTADGLPCDWSFRAKVRQGDRTFDVGVSTVPALATTPVALQSSPGLFFGSVRDFDQSKPVDLILLPGGPKHPWTKDTVDLWQGTIIFPGLTAAMQRAADDWGDWSAPPVTPFDRASVILKETDEPESAKPTP